MAARDLLAAQGVISNVWSVTSYNELARQALECERHRLLSVGAVDEGPSLVESLLDGEKGVFVAASDYMKALPLAISKWIPGPYVVLGTDGFGLSEDRHELRQHFEVSAAWIAFASLSLLAQNEVIAQKVATTFAEEQNLNLAKAAPFLS